MFWMEWSTATRYFWSFSVCKVETGGKREPTPIPEAKREARAAKKAVTPFDQIVQAVKREFFDPMDASGDGVLCMDDVKEMAQKLVAMGDSDDVPASHEEVQE